MCTRKASCFASGRGCGPATNRQADIQHRCVREVEATAEQVREIAQPPNRPKPVHDGKEIEREAAGRAEREQPQPAPPFAKGNPSPSPAAVAANVRAVAADAFYPSSARDEAAHGPLEAAHPGAFGAAEADVRVAELEAALRRSRTGHPP